MVDGLQISSANRQSANLRTSFFKDMRTLCKCGNLRICEVDLWTPFVVVLRSCLLFQPPSFSFFPALIPHCLFALFSAHVFSFLLSTIFRRRKVMHHTIRGNSFVSFIHYTRIHETMLFVSRLLLFWKYMYPSHVVFGEIFRVVVRHTCTDRTYACRRHLNRQRHESELALQE